MRWNWNPFKVDDNVMTFEEQIQSQARAALKEAVRLTSKRPAIQRYLERIEKGSWSHRLAEKKLRQLNVRIDTIKANYGFTEEDIQTQAEIMRIQELN